MGNLTLFLTSAIAIVSCGGAVASPPPVVSPAPCPAAPSVDRSTVTCPPGATWSGTACVARLLAAPTDFDSLIEAQTAANARPGVRHIPARDIPVPTADVSPEVQALIGTPYRSVAVLHPRDAAQWKMLVQENAERAEKTVRPLAAKMHVTITPTTIAGVPCFLVAPEVIPPQNRNRLLVFVHGGAYVFGPGVAGTKEAVLLAAFGGFKVVAVDYRMPPDFPYPAALDDAMAVWKQAVTTTKPKNLAIFGSSTGGAMTMSMVLRAKDEHLPLPAAIAPGTPWADLTNTGDSYRTNEWLDGALVSAGGRLGDAARLYAGSHDPKDPYLSPIYGDLHGFPPSILTTGTRDLFLSNTVRAHRKLRRAGVEAELHVYEGQSHSQFSADPDAPETKEAMTEIATFFDRHLGR